MSLDRRTFIRKSSSLVAYSSLLACQPKPAKLPKKKSLGIALVGLGSYSRGQLAPSLQSTKHCHLAGIVTGTPSKIPEWKEQYGIEDKNVYSYETLHQIKDNDDIDVVYIVVPTALHSKYAVIAANAGKHVWCEKPMALNTQQCQDIIDACDKNGVKLSIGYRMLHEPNTQKLISNLESKPFGSIESVVAESGYAGGGGSGWRFEKAMGGGAMYDMGVYSVNGLRYATGQEPISVLSAKHIIDRPDLFKEVDETTEFELEFASGIKAIGRTSVGRGFNQLRVACKDGWYKCEPMQSYGGVSYSDSSGLSMPAISGKQQTLQMDNDALAIMNDTPVMAPGIEGKKDIRIIEAIFESAATGQPVVI